MKKLVLWQGRSREQVFAIEREMAIEILRSIDQYLSTGFGDVKRLRPPRTELRLRFEDYRVFFVSHGPRSIEVLAVKHRSEAYR